MNKNSATLWLIVVAALGYFVDIYDLVLFNVVKKESLEFIQAHSGVSMDIKNTGIFLFNCQMLGMLLGGLLWGIWGDKKGRISVLFGSILLYSVANIVNAFTFDVPTYAVIRIIAGIGLAGELGAGITLVSETMDKEKRGYGTMIIVTFGALGAVVAALVGAKGSVLVSIIEQISGYRLMNWQVVYLFGGFLGLLLLLLRVGTFESGMYKELSDKQVKKGDFISFLKKPNLLWRYISCIMIGLPTWFLIGVPVSLSQDVFAPLLGLEGLVNGTAVMFAYLGLSVGDLASGALSQFLKSRKKVVYIYLFLSLMLLCYYVFFMKNISLEEYYFICFLIGFAAGYWAIFVSIAAEQFGTNIRSTVTNTVPNFVRGAVLPITMSFSSLSVQFLPMQAAFIVGLVCILLAFWATFQIKESFAKDLDYIETM